MKENHKRVQSIFAARFRAPTKWGQNGDGPSCFVFWATEPYGILARIDHKFPAASPDARPQADMA